MLTASVWCAHRSQLEWAALVVKGLARHGVQRVADRSHAEIGIVWGVRNRGAWSACRHVLVMERAYLGDRFRWLSLAWDGLNGLGNFCNDDVPDDRWRRYWRDSMQPQTTGSGALIIGQVQGDMATLGVDLCGWAQNVSAGLSAMGVPHLYRPHPEAIKRGQRQPKIERDHRQLEDALSACDSVITYNSNVGVLAAMAGKRVTCENDGAMAWGVAGHGWRDDRDLGDRDEWGRQLAYCQWTPEEVVAGDWWTTMRRVFE